MQKEIVTLIRQSLPSVRMIYLFGSRATGQHRIDSDWDVAVLSHQQISNELLTDVKYRLEKYLNADVDLIDLARASTVMRAQIINNGVAIYAADENDKAAYEVFVQMAYCDLNEERKHILADIHERGSIYG